MVGELMLDVVAVLTFGPFRRRQRHPGPDPKAPPVGSAANVAAWLAAVGTPVPPSSAGSGTTPRAGRAGAALLGVAGGVQVRASRWNPRRPTGTCVVLVGADGERSMLPDPGANLALSPGDVPAVGCWSRVRTCTCPATALLRTGSRAAARHALAAGQRPRG